jgi:hypothetical protein
MSSVSSLFTNPYYGINQANGTRPTDAAKQAKDDAIAGATNGLADAPGIKKDATEEFLDYAKLSVPERIRKQFLESKDLDEKSLAAMSEEERQKIEDEFRELLEKKMKEGMNKEAAKKAGSTGLVANLLV